MVANDEQLPITKYVEGNLNFMGLIVPRVGILATIDQTSSWTQHIRPGYQE